VVPDEPLSAARKRPAHSMHLVGDLQQWRSASPARSHSCRAVTAGPGIEERAQFGRCRHFALHFSLVAIDKNQPAVSPDV
jgi:hypothetical protein